jgi:hypothetical protein
VAGGEGVRHRPRLGREEEMDVVLPPGVHGHRRVALAPREAERLQEIPDRLRLVRCELDQLEAVHVEGVRRARHRPCPFGIQDFQ